MCSSDLRSPTVTASKRTVWQASQLAAANRLHLSVQGSATSYEAVNFVHREFSIQRAVLLRVLTLAQIELVIRNTPVKIKVFGFDSLCVMNEGRC